MKINSAQEINESEFDAQVLAAKEPALVGFLAGWSRACKRIEPVLEEVARACEGAARVFKVDVDDNPRLGAEYGIQSIPTLIFFREGAVRLRIVGTVSARAVLDRLELRPANSEADQTQSKPRPGNKQEAAPRASKSRTNKNY